MFINGKAASCKSDFYQVVNTCAIRKDEIVSVEQFEVIQKEVETND